jgi:hypothetical protein
VTYEVCCLSIFEREDLKPGQVFSSTILTFDTLNRGRTVSAISFLLCDFYAKLSPFIFRMICYVKDGEIRMMNGYLVLLFSLLGSEIGIFSWKSPKHAALKSKRK